MNCIKAIWGSGLALMLTLTAPLAWAQSAPDNMAASGATAANWSTHDSASVMDQNVAREIKHAWSQGQDATLAMAFQENGEIALSEGKEKEARQYFHAAEQALGPQTPSHTSYLSHFGRALLGEAE